MTPLRERMLEDMQIRSLSPQTQRAYVEHVARFARHFGRSPADLDPEEMRTYQVSLIRERHLAPSSLEIAVMALAVIATTLGGHRRRVDWYLAVFHVCATAGRATLTARFRYRARRAGRSTATPPHTPKSARLLTRRGSSPDGSGTRTPRPRIDLVLDNGVLAIVQNL